ncbi:MAG: hypothetical protein LUC18_01525, partial [Porphyromonadaceae bacterium]|nr:hypothetical protein [Porphyromonadaceae bacterium]
MAGELLTLIPQYGGLNRIYEDYIADNAFSFGEQKYITDFCRQLGDSQAFETAVLDLILDRPKEQYSLILNRLKDEIDRNIRLYEMQTLPDAEAIDRVCYQHFKSHDRAIERQMEITRELNTLLNEASNRYDSIGYREHTTREEEQAEREYEHCKAEYEKEKEELDRLLGLRDTARKEA